MNNTLTSGRSQQFTESLIREMTRLAVEHDAINLAQGFPDYDSPEAMLEAAVKAIYTGLNQYANTWGTKNLREAVADKFRWFQRSELDPEKEITITCGTTEGLFVSMMAIIDPGDEVIIFEPYYESYGPDAFLSNATPKYVSLRKPTPSNDPEKKGEEAWTFDFDELTAAFNNKTKAIIINTPNNPTGKVFTEEELQFIAELCQKWNTIAITDETYEHILFDGLKHLSLATVPGMRERTITVSGISKTYAATGWRVGWVIAPAHLTSSIRKIHDFVTVAAPHPFQEAAAVALNSHRTYYNQLADDYEKRRNFLLPVLLKVGFKCSKPAGAYYIMSDFSALKVSRSYKIQSMNDVQFAQWLVKTIGIAGVPGSSFYHDPKLAATQIRFSFGRKMQLLMDAEARFTKLSQMQ